MRAPAYPPKPRPGDRVAVVSPGAGLVGVFPHVFDAGLRRLREQFGLEPVEYPTTRAVEADPRDRARDLTAAFADPSVTAVLAAIGGDDMITVVPHLDADVIRAHPKPYFGFSDNTNVLNFLYGQGIVGYHGGSVLVHLGRGGGPHPVTADSLRAALFTDGWYELTAAEESGDESGDWGDPAHLDVPPAMAPVDGWSWYGPRRVVQGPVWGGNLEILSWLLQAGRVGPDERYDGHVLLLETSEEMPSDVEVFRTLRNMGERRLLARFDAALIGRAKAWHFDRPNDAAAKAAYRAAQHDAVRRAFAAYAPRTVLVLDLDVGHTDPQLVLPYGGPARVDAVTRRIAVRY